VGNRLTVLSKTTGARRLSAILLPGALALVVAGCNGSVGVGIGATTTTTTGSGPTTTSTSSTSTTSTTSTTTTTTMPPTTTTTTAPVITPPTCGGEQNLVADGTSWVCTFDSEFTGTSLDRTQWTPVVTATSGYTSGDTACFVDSPNNISVGNGYLTLTARQESAPFVCNDPDGSFSTQYTSGSLTTSGIFSQAFGRVEVSAKVPSTSIQGLQSSFWLYHQPGNDGEIDIAETYTSNPGLAIPYIHYSPNPFDQNASTNTNIVTNTTCTINPDQFNDYVVEWSSTTITIIYNGQTCMIDNYDELGQPAGTPFTQPLFMNLTQALGINTNNFEPGTTPLPATTEVQFVRVWKAAS
jgi:hypothetical protein